MVNLVRERECFVGLSSLLVYALRTLVSGISTSFCIASDACSGLFSIFNLQNCLFLLQSKAVEENQGGANPDEIDIDEDEDEDGEGQEEAEAVQVGSVEKMDVPDKVFGSLKKNDE